MRTKREKITFSDALLRDLYERMLRIRRFEEKIIELYPEQQMKTPVHLCLGQEAIASGVCCNLRRDDYIFSTHRNHGHYLAKGGDIRALTSELYGKKNGCSGGRGGSMHVIDPEAGVCGSSAIVGGNIPLAAGAGLACYIKDTDQVSVAFFGDGAVEEGTFHESLNFASLKKLPVVFVCENNHYAVHSHISVRQPHDAIYKLARNYLMPGVRVNGNDAIAVFSAAQEAVNRARSGGGPTLIEGRTYRWKGHVGPEVDTHLGYRSQEELDEWMRKCPVKKMKTYLLRNKIMTDEEMGRLVEGIDGELNEAHLFAKKSAFPQQVDLLRGVDKDALD